jgi:hypothetical protein
VKGPTDEEEIICSKMDAGLGGLCWVGGVGFPAGTFKLYHVCRTMMTIMAYDDCAAGNKLSMELVLWIRAWLALLVVWKCLWLRTSLLPMSQSSVERRGRQQIDWTHLQEITRGFEKLFVTAAMIKTTSISSALSICQCICQCMRHVHFEIN